MNASGKKTAIDKIKELIVNFEFENRIPKDKSLQEKTLKEVSKLFSVEIVTSEVVKTTTSDLAFETLLKTKKYEEGKDKTQKFSEFSEINIDEICNRIFDELSSLPKSYSFVLRLPQSEHMIKRLNINPNIEIFSLDEPELSLYSSVNDPSRGFLSSITNQAEFKKGEVILRVKGHGFIGKYGLVKTYIVDPLYSMKAIFGIYLALDIITASKQYPLWGFSRSYSYFAFETISNKLVRQFDESTNDEKYIQKMKFKKEAFVLSDLDKLINKTKTKFNVANEILSKIFADESELSKITSVESVKFQTILKNTSYWFYEMLKTPEEHIRTVYLTTAFDSLLGSVDNEREVTKEMKAEIIANTTANNASEAIKIKDLIKKFYELRNNIIHGKKAISALEQYSEVANQDYTLTMSSYYFSRFFANRIYFLSNGIFLKPKT